MADYDKDTIAEEYISSLQRRLVHLETLVIGEEKVREGQPPLLNILKTIDRKLNALVEVVNGSTPVFTLWKQIPELERILDPKYLNSLKLNESATQELLLCYADQLHKYQQDIDDLHQLKDAINSMSLQGIETTEKSIAQLSSVHIQQEEKVAQLATCVQSFLDSYSKFLLQVSSQCVKWDETLTQLETKS